jgi:hypothetical protein
MSGGIRGDPARDLGTLHHICVTHLKDLHVMAKSKVRYWEHLHLFCSKIFANYSSI